MTLTNKAILNNAIGAIQSQLRLSVRTINNGGCGFFALTLSRELTRIGVRHEIVVSSKRKTFTMSQLKKKMNASLLNSEGKGTIPIEFGHALIKIGDIYYDGHWRYGAFPHDCGIEVGVLSEQDLDIFVRRGRWHHDHPKSANPLVMRTIKVHIREIQSNFI